MIWFISKQYLVVKSIRYFMIWHVLLNHFIFNLTFCFTKPCQNQWFLYDFLFFSLFFTLFFTCICWILFFIFPLKFRFNEKLILLLIFCLWLTKHLQQVFVMKIFNVFKENRFIFNRPKRCITFFYDRLTYFWWKKKLFWKLR